MKQGFILEVVPSIVEPVARVLQKAGAAEAARTYRALKKDKPDGYDFSEKELNRLGYQLLREGKPDAAVAALQTRVRKQPSDPKLRVFLFQLLCVVGDWERARNQLKALAELDAGSLPLVHLYGAAINCELLRRDVFAGARTPVMLGEPLPWVALLLQALAAEAQGKQGEAKRLRGETGDLRERHFEPCEVAFMIPHAAFAQAKRVQNRLRLLDSLRALRRDREARGEPARQARRRRLVPRRQAPDFRQSPHIRLREARLLKRMPHRAVVNFLLSMQREPGLGARDVVGVLVVDVLRAGAGFGLVEDERAGADVLVDLLHGIGFGFALAHHEAGRRVAAGERIEHQAEFFLERDGEGFFVLGVDGFEPLHHQLGGTVAGGPALQ